MDGEGDVEGLVEAFCVGGGEGFGGFLGSLLVMGYFLVFYFRSNLALRDV